MNLFKPVGEKSRKDFALEVLREHSVGDVVPYATFGDRLGDDARRVIQAAVRDAGKDFLKLDGHAIEAVPNVGYRVVEPDGHVRLAEKQRKRSVRSLRRGSSLVSSVDYNGMSAESRRLAEGMAMGFAHLLEQNARMDARVRSVEVVADAVAEKQDRTDSEVAELRARLSRLESAE